MEFLAPTSTCTCWAMQVHGYLVYVIHVVHNLLSRTTSTNLFSQTPDWIGHRCKQTMQYLYCSQWVTTDQKLTNNYDSAIRQHCLFSLFLETRLIFSSFFFSNQCPCSEIKTQWLDRVGLSWPAAPQWKMCWMNLSIVAYWPQSHCVNLGTRH